MSTLLVRHISYLITMDDHRREIPGGGLFISDGFVRQVGVSNELPEIADEVLDLD
jgi:8-oxoguanine deaminase